MSTIELGHSLPPASAESQRRWLPDLVALLWVIGAAVVLLTPALIHGTSLGPYEQLSNKGLTQPKFGTGGSDLLTQFIPWTSLAWTEIHHGHLPLWNPYSALGMPLAFNWTSSAFSVPALIGYLFPVRYAFTVQILSTVVVAGSGAYVCGRALRMSALSCALAGTVFELSGAFLLWLGWPMASVFSWTGWLFAALILILRGGRRAVHIVFFAVVLAFTIYAGQPDALAALAIGTVLFFLVLLVLRSPFLGGSGAILKPLFDTAVAAVAGLALAAPLLLPGATILGASERLKTHGAFGLKGGFGFKHLESIAFAGLNGVRITGQPGYLGVIVVVLAISAIGLRRRQPEVIALACVAVMMALVAYISPVTHALNSLPFFHSVKLSRAAVPAAFSVAMLAGMGMDLLVRSSRSRSVLIWLGAGFVAAGAILAGWWILGPELTQAKESLRASGLLWVAGETLVGLVGVGSLVLVRTGIGLHGSVSLEKVAKVVGASFVACATSFLLVVGVPLWTSSPTYLASSSADQALQHAVGSSIVGSGTQTGRYGIYRDLNAMFGVHEFAVIDGALPTALFKSWKLVTGRPQGGEIVSQPFYSPAFTSATLARAYGVGFVMEPAGHRGPSGGVFDAKIGNEDLYSIPGAGAATLGPLAPDGSFPSNRTSGKAVPVTYPGPASWRLETDAKTEQALRLHLNNTPGWHATIDGRPLPLTTFAGVMLEARIPPGHHVIKLNYWPATFTVGIVAASLAVLGLSIAVVAEALRKRRNPSEPVATGSVP